jgi:hypothetical protein
MRVILAFGLFTLASLARGQEWTPSEVQYRQKLGPVIDAILNDVPLRDFKKLIGDDFDGPIAQTNWTPLCFAVAHRRNAIALWLMNQGASPNISLAKSKTLLNLAAENQSGQVVEELARRGLDLSHPDENGMTARRWAVFHTRTPWWTPELAQTLWRLGERFDASERWVLINHLAPMACRTNSFEYEDVKSSREIKRYRELIDQLWHLGVKEETPEWYAATSNREWEPLPLGERHPVTVAARQGDLDTLKMMLKYVSDWLTNTKLANDGGLNLTGNAMQCHNLHVVRWLVAHGYGSPRVTSR